MVILLRQGITDAIHHTQLIPFSGSDFISKLSRTVSTKDNTVLICVSSRVSCSGGEAHAREYLWTQGSRRIALAVTLPLSTTLSF